jgi:CheY-like chemotaxis protein
MAAPSSYAVPATPRARLSAREVLVVDDDRDLCRSLRETLEEEGYRVRTAAHGLEALAMLMAGALPDVILLDMLMPVMDGWQLISELKGRPAFATIPVAAMTAAGPKVLFAAPVCAGYLAKPMGRTRLLDMVALCLARAPRR